MFNNGKRGVSAEVVHLHIRRRGVSAEVLQPCLVKIGNLRYLSEVPSPHARGWGGLEQQLPSYFTKRAVSVHQFYSSSSKVLINLAESRSYKIWSLGKKGMIVKRTWIKQLMA